MIKTQLKLLVVEDHELTRLGLVASLAKFNKVQVIAEAESGDEALKLVETKRPDLVLMDIAMPVMDGIEATQKLKQSHPDIKVLILTSHNEQDMVFAALAAGADGYCMKDVKLERLVEVIEHVMEGAAWLDPAIAQIVMKSLPKMGSHNTSGGNTGTSSVLSELTEREREVLNVIANGKSNKDIASTLHISIYTVKAHVCNIIQKLAVDDRTQAAIKALREGLVQA